MEALSIVDLRTPIMGVCLLPIYTGITGKSQSVPEQQMTSDQVQEYMQGYDECSDRKFG